MRKVEYAPFFIWSMYSAEIPERDTFSTICIRVDGEALNLSVLEDHKRLLYTYSPANYLLYVENNHEDPYKKAALSRLERLKIPSSNGHHLFNTASEIDAYPGWLKLYLQSSFDKNIQQVQADKIQLHYDTLTGRVHIDQVQTFIKR